jgi:hypothetical protein
VFGSRSVSTIHLHNYFLCFSIVYPRSVDVFRPCLADHWSCSELQARDPHSCCICACSFFESKNCAAFCLQCFGLERASRSLAKTGSSFCDHIEASLKYQDLVLGRFCAGPYCSLAMRPCPITEVPSRAVFPGAFCDSPTLDRDGCSPQALEM